MLTYKYKAISKDGKNVNGVIEAYDEFEAVDKIKESCNVVVKIEPVAESKSELIKKLNEPMSIKEKTLSLISSQFAILLRSGLPAARTVGIIAEQCSDKYMKKILESVAEDAQAGYSIASSFELRGKKLPPTFIETIRAGEESGTLDQSFDKLARYYDKSSKLKSKVRGAMIYPAFLIVLAIIVVTIVVKVAVPTIAGVIVESGGEIPGLTKVLLGMYDFFEKWGVVVIILILALIIGCRLYDKTPKGKQAFSELAFKIPVIGNIIHMNAASQFASTMTTLLTAGLPLNRSMSITGRVMDNYAAGSTVEKATVGLEEGKSLGEVLQGNPYLPPLLIEMAAVGEKSGSLEDTLTTIGEYYDSEVEQSSAKALSMLEPIITIVMGIVIGFIVIALYLPMFTMYSGY